MLHYAVTIFVSAFLLFQVQPIIAKIILPWFGGSAAVWTTCMLFFQMTLLVGYLYSHWTTQKLPSRAQSTIHIVLLLASLAVLPVVPGDAWKPTGQENPTFKILALLAATVGIPYFLLSTTGPLVQAWFARSNPGKSPYRLFALSNIGSMIALIGYPIFVEPNLATRLQAVVWSGAYGAFCLLCGTLAWTHRSLAPVSPTSPVTDTPAEAPPLRHWLLWISLSACASVLLLSITNHLTTDVAPIPFLWVLPLVLYLVSFILTFDSAGWYNRLWYLPLTAIALAAITYTVTKETEIPVQGRVAILAVSLFLCCMSCHGEIAALKPHPRYLTGFYLMISIGGALGGLFVGVVAPYVFFDYFELPVGIIGCALLVVLVHVWDNDSPLRRTKSGWGWAVTVAVILAISYPLSAHYYEENSDFRLRARNFYGGLRTGDYGTRTSADWSRKLTHGVINHGEQYLNPQRSREQTSYFGPNSGVGRAIASANRESPQRLGITGLGAGVMITYARPGDYMRIYEINPLVVDVAKKEFTFIKECPGKLDIAMGDARLSLEREQPQNFDVLHMDAFSSDSVPVHLLTKEAFQLYFRHLKPNGLLVIHISNRYLRLEPVVARAAEALGKFTVFVDDEGDSDLGFYGTDMVVLANHQEDLDKSRLKGFKPAMTDPKVLLWTDDYSNLFRIVK